MRTGEAGPSLAWEASISMKLASVLCSLSLGAALATACGGIETTSDQLGPDDAGGALDATAPREAGSSPGQKPGAPTGAADAGGPAFNVSCQSAQTCPRSEVCCASFSFGGAGGGGIDVACASACAAGGYQVCATSAECTTRGDVCSPSPLGVGNYCTPSRDAGTGETVDGGTAVDGGGVRDASGDGASAGGDAASGGDATVVDAGAGPDAGLALDATAFVNDAANDVTTVDAAGDDATGDDATGDDATGGDATGGDDEGGEGGT
jgi:hypothetical protein